MSQGLGFVIVLLNVGVCWFFHRQAAVLWPRRRSVWGALTILACVVALHPSLLLALGGRSALRAWRATVPTWLSLTNMVAQFVVWICVFAIPVFLLVRWAVNAHARRRVLRAEVAPVDERRRKMLAGVALSVPIGATVVSGAGAWAARQGPVVTRILLPVRREFSELAGLKLAQVSDVHIGTYMDAYRLDEVAHVMNALSADFHVITGDLLDNHISQMELATRFIRSLAPTRAQVFACMGNHEYIAARTSSVSEVMQGLAAAGAQVLVDEARKVRVGAHHLWMSGINHPPRSVDVGARTTEESLRLVVNAMGDDGAPRVVLSHHPRTFNQARALPLDLMLSGHTHGGQIKLGRVGDYALTPVLPVDFYHNGLYEHQGRRLYVNAGAGGWLPVRLNCPPEITLVEFMPA